MNALGLAPSDAPQTSGPSCCACSWAGSMCAHGFQKWFDIGPPNFGSSSIDALGLPAPEFFGYLVATSAGLRRAARARAPHPPVDDPLGVILGVAVIGVKLGEVGLIAGMDAMTAGYELDLALLAGLVALLFLGGGRLSLDRVLGLDRGPGPARSSGASASAAGRPTLAGSERRLCAFGARSANLCRKCAGLPTTSLLRGSLRL